MALVLDAKSSKLYESWCRSARGREYERFVDATLRTLLNPQPGERVLDIGCGEGAHLSLLSGLGLEAAGIDASPYMIGRAREHLEGGTDLKVGRAEDLPYDDNEFDLALLTNTLEFLEDPLQALREAGRVARRKVFIGVMNSLSWHYVRSKWGGLFKESIFNHLRFYDLWEMKALLREAYGETLTEWSCARMKAGFVERIGVPLSEFWKLRHFPLGAFLGLSVSFQYRLRTAQHPLKIKLGETRRPAIKGVPTTSEWSPPPPLPTGGRSRERGLSL
ncbi:MAG: methyltransferase domain-containing protein [Deltaproteobacteria bacterium]|nr:methyltransferase domain-containing protein [Deltaproteobacteria bacterium]